MEGLRLAELRFGQRLRLGPQVIGEVRLPCEPCFRMDEIRMGLQDELAGRRGVFVQIIEGDGLKVGDAIKVIPQD